MFWLQLPGSPEPPDIYRDIPNELQLAAMENGVRRLRELWSLTATLSIVNYPFWAPLVRRLTNNVVLYDCMDDYACFGNAGRPARELESGLVRDADVVACASAHLQRRMQANGRERVLVRNAVDVRHFASPPASLAIERTGRTAGYWGATAEWTDIELLAYAARAALRIRQSPARSPWRRPIGLLVRPVHPLRWQCRRDAALAEPGAPVFESDAARSRTH